MCFVQDCQLKKIVFNYLCNFGLVDMFSYLGYQQIMELLFEEFCDCVVLFEKFVFDFCFWCVVIEIVVFFEVGEILKEFVERVFFNEVIILGEMCFEEVVWWFNEQLFECGFGSLFGMLLIYVIGFNGVEVLLNDCIIQCGDVLMIDWGVGLMNFYIDMKWIVYVLCEGEIRVFESIQKVFDCVIEVCGVIKKMICVGIFVGQVEEEVYVVFEDVGFKKIGFNQLMDDELMIDVVIGCYLVGNSGYGIGLFVVFFNFVCFEYEL